ncbi:undecaprenyl-phosphate glucose phosphotransferase [Nitrincola tibetensis]|nr:undecaprenyl-phosphate glucose phosphotransferase [Nitrincola tibetensis]
MIESNPNLRFSSKSTSVYRIIDMMFMVVMLLLAMYINGIPYGKDYWLLLFANLAIFSYLGESMQLYRVLRAGQFTLRIMLLFAVLSISFLLTVFMLFLMKEAETYSRLTLMSWYLLSLFSFIGWRLIYRKIKHQRYANGFGLRKVAIIGLTPSGLKLQEQINKHKEMGLKCIGFFDDRTEERLAEHSDQLIGKVQEAVEMAQRNEINKLYICLPLLAEKRIANIIHELGDSTVDVLLVPDFLLKNLMHANVSSVGNIDTISVFESPLSGIKEFYKRTFDILFSACALIGISPVLIGVALAIKLTSPGPILFRQDRYGLDGKRIGVYKFRSMKVMENKDVVVQATKGDSRITPVGAFIRRTSLDELPQFFNVLIGDMSVVGPRPHAVAHNEEYRKQVDYYMLRHKVRPGITGWAQINGWRGETDTLEKMEKRIEYDLEYIRNWSLWLDIKIIFLTFFKGFVNKNAY